MLRRNCGGPWEQSGSIGEQRVDELQWGTLRAGTKIAKAETLFPRIEKQEAVERMEAMESEPQKPVVTPPAASASAPTGASGAAAQTAPEKIAIEDFAKVEMRVGQIKTAERIRRRRQTAEVDSRHRSESAPDLARASRSITNRRRWSAAKCGGG